MLWTNDYWQKARIQIDNSIVNIFFIHSNNMIMFKKNDFTLIQYNQDYEDRYEKLIADVNVLDDEKVETIIQSNENNWNRLEEVKQYVKIIITENFKIKRIYKNN